MNDHDECLKAIRKFGEDVVKGYIEKSDQKLDEPIRGLTNEEFFLLTMIVLFDFYESKDGKDETGSRNLCDSCINTRCILQSGIVRNRCYFYKPACDIYCKLVNFEEAENDCSKT